MKRWDDVYNPDRHGTLRLRLLVATMKYPRKQRGTQDAKL